MADPNQPSPTPNGPGFSTDNIVSTMQGLVKNIALLNQLIAAPGNSLSQIPTATASAVVSPKATIYTTLSTSSVQVIAASPTRRAMTFVNSNPSGNNIWVVPSNVTAVINQGILIVPGGQYPT